MRILVDTNVLLDVALGREPFLRASAQVLDWCQDNPGASAIAWHSVSNLSDLLKGDAHAFLTDLLSFVEVASGTTLSVRAALGMKTRDFEDALQIVSAMTFKADHIVTRNVRDLRALPVSALSPAAFLKLL
jgi:predicted nucleic acid-binding protein